MRRVQNFKLVNSKCMVIVEQWRKLSHSNLVALRQVFTTKEFGDQSIIFVYDFYPGAETLMAKHFSNSSSLPGNSPFMDPYGWVSLLIYIYWFKNQSLSYWHLFQPTKFDLSLTSIVMEMTVQGLHHSAEECIQQGIDQMLTTIWINKIMECFLNH